MSSFDLALADGLMATVVGCKLSTRRFGVSRALPEAQRKQVAEVFDADDALLAAGKKILDTKDRSWRAVTKVLSQAKGQWELRTLPFPEPAVRLLKRTDVDVFVAEMTAYKSQLDQALARLDDAYWSMRQTAKERLGDLFDVNDYPDALSEFFGLAWDFPSLQPPPFLMAVNPAVYEQQMARIRARFDDAITLAEQAFSTELKEMLDHLCDRLDGTEDGQPKIFRDTAITNLREFAARFKHLSVRSNDDLDTLVSQVERLAAGIDPSMLRDNRSLRETARSAFSRMNDQLSEMMADRPRRMVKFRATKPVDAS